MPDFGITSLLTSEPWPLSMSTAALGVSAIAIGLLGTRITRVVDQLADRTGMGEAVAGAVLLGASTSLSGSVVSVSAAWHGYTDLAVSNAIGGIAVQTAFLAVADLFYRRANLEHAAASTANMLQAALLIALLSLILLAPLMPPWAPWGIHPVTPLLFAFYLYGIHLVRGARVRPMWHPTRTDETREDRPQALSGVPPLPRLVVEFLLLMALLGACGLVVERAATGIVAHSGLSESIVGTLFTAVSTSLPELVTSVAAVRRGALTLAVGGIIGGNAFDTLFTAAADVAYRDGSIYHTISDEVSFWVTLTILMSAVLIMGLIRREKLGPGRIGFESAALLVLYAAGVLKLLF